MPKGYLYGEVEVIDPAQYEKYRPLAAKSIEDFGGRYLIRGGDAQVLEGDRPMSRAVLVEFPTRERAEEFYYSEQYQRAKAIRVGAAKAQLVLFSGTEA
jgi:uncharacterized protein (DUF1330 family)